MDLATLELAKLLGDAIAPFSNIALVYIALAVFKLERRVTRMEVEQWAILKSKGLDG